MATEKPASATVSANSTEADALDPRDTDHPTGTQQAAENAANDPPG